MQKIYIAMHKPYAVPKNALYVPLQVGAEGKKPFCAARDNGGGVGNYPFFGGRV